MARRAVCITTLIILVLGISSGAESTPFTFSSIDFPGAEGRTVVNGINAVGDLVGIYLGTDDNVHGFALFNGGSPNQQFIPIDVPGATNTFVNRINSSRQI